MKDADNKLQAMMVRSSKYEKKEGEFYKELGQFVAQFARVESQMPRVVAHYAKMDPKICRAVLQNLRVDAAVSILNRLIDSRKLRTKKAAELVAVISHVSLINSLRNNLLHLGIKPVGIDVADRYSITNRINAYSRRVTRTIPISKKILSDINTDLVYVSLYLIEHMGFPAPRGFIGKIRKGFRFSHPLGQQPSWRYKPAPQPKVNPPSHARFPKLKTPPSSSPA